MNKRVVLSVYLDKDGEQDNGERCRDEHLARLDDVWREHFHQAEADCTSQSAVSHYKLLLQIDRFQPKAVGNSRQQEHACRIQNLNTSKICILLKKGEVRRCLTSEASNQAEEQSPQNESRVPFVDIVDEDHAKKEEDDGIASAA